MKKYVESPIDKLDEQGLKYLTKGKKYEISERTPNKSFEIKDDSGKKLFCLYTRCAHLNDLNWIKL